MSALGLGRASGTNRIEPPSISRAGRQKHRSPERKIPRSIHEEARDVARALAGTVAFEQSRRNRKRVEMLFAHLKRILRLGRLRLRAAVRKTSSPSALSRKTFAGLRS